MLINSNNENHFLTRGKYAIVSQGDIIRRHRSSMLIYFLDKVYWHSVSTRNVMMKDERCSFFLSQENRLFLPTNFFLNCVFFKFHFYIPRSRLLEAVLVLLVFPFFRNTTLQTLWTSKAIFNHATNTCAINYSRYAFSPIVVMFWWICYEKS